MPLSKSWHEYNESLIERGRILMDISFLGSSNREIKNMNKGKVGAPFDIHVRSSRRGEPMSAPLRHPGDGILNEVAIEELRF